MKAKNQKLVLEQFRLNRYYCDSDGSVYSNCRSPQNKRLRPKTKRNGYLSINLCIFDGGVIPVFVHQLVYLFFNGGYNPDLEINHLNGVKKDNRFNNLEVVTKSRNKKHSYEIGIMPIHKGSKKTLAKLTEDSVKYIREQVSAGVPQCFMAAEFDVSRQLISRVVSGERWKHI